MTDHAHWMRRALQLAKLGAGWVAPNPLVGAVLVRGEHILAEGWHKRFGGSHAEVELLKAYGDGPVPEDAVLYVSLEPCSHHGKTPPCADLIIEREIKHVVVALEDPFPQVAGCGIKRMQEAGIDVTVGVLADEARWLNRTFVTSILAGRPYILLKWARSQDGFLDRHPRGSRGVQRISDPVTDVRVHIWRSMHQAIMVGSRTVINDDPTLTVRHVTGPDPLRVILDRKGSTTAASQVFTDGGRTLLFTTSERPELDVEQLVLSGEEDPLVRILAELYDRNIRSLMIEGGRELLQHFIDHGLWDEARVITGQLELGQGTVAPSLPGSPIASMSSGGDRIDLHVNVNSPVHEQGRSRIAWSW